MNEPICIVPTYEREELLFLCLEAIRRESPEIPIFVYSDHGATSRDLVTTTDEFKANLVIRHFHNYYGNTWNILEAAQAAVRRRPAVVHIIEDDAIIHRGYLKWAQEQLASNEYAAVCARIPSPNLKYWYDAPCATWTPEALKWCFSMIPPGYFCESREEMQRLLDLAFPKSVYRKGGAEQDGFFLRCIEAQKWATAFPQKPLATHLGYFGYNRAGATRSPGSLEERVAYCRALLDDKVRRIALFGLDITMKEWDGRV